MRRPDAGTQLGDEINGVAPKLLRHPKNRLPNYIEKGSFFPGMHESNRSAPRINQKNRAAVSNIDAQKDVAITGHNRIHSRTLSGRPDRHHSNSIAMNLFSQTELARKKSSSYALMTRLKPLESGRSIASDIEAGDSQRKPVQNIFQSIEGRKQLHGDVSH
jgi:hypothetical protein